MPRQSSPLGLAPQLVVLEPDRRREITIFFHF
jgi:hypothetical protein